MSITRLDTTVVLEPDTDKEKCDDTEVSMLKEIHEQLTEVSRGEVNWKFLALLIVL